MSKSAGGQGGGGRPAPPEDSRAVIEVDAARDCLAALAARACRGERVVLTLAGEPYAVLGPPSSGKQAKALPHAAARAQGWSAQRRALLASSGVSALLAAATVALAAWAPREYAVLGFLGIVGVVVIGLFAYEWPE